MLLDANVMLGWAWLWTEGAQTAVALGLAALGLSLLAGGPLAAVALSLLEGLGLAFTLLLAGTSLPVAGLFGLAASLLAWRSPGARRVALGAAAGVLGAMAASDWLGWPRAVAAAAAGALVLAGGWASLNPTARFPVATSAGLGAWLLASDVWALLGRTPILPSEYVLLGGTVLIEPSLPYLAGIAVLGALAGGFRRRRGARAGR